MKFTFSQRKRMLWEVRGILKQWPSEVCLKSRFESPDVVQLLSLSNSLWPHRLQHARFPSPHHLPEFTQTHVHWIGDAVQLSHSLLPLLLPPSVFPSIRVFPNESALSIRWPKYWSFSFSISPSNEHSGLISLSIPQRGVSVSSATAEDTDPRTRPTRPQSLWKEHGTSNF